MTRAQGFGQGPGFYPSLLGYALIGLGLATLAKGLRAPVSTEAGEKSDKQRYGLVFGVLALSIITVALIPYIGFIAASFILVLAMIQMIRPSGRLKHWLIDIFFTILVLFMIYIVFEVFIKIQLPRGLWLH